jgi:hydroxymethylpyrimidine/phosphomethylpyrimidine kinase
MSSPVVVTPVVWTIAGFDPSSGAGITADLKTISSLGCYGVACITALTVQNTLGVRRVEPVSAKTVLETLQALRDDLPPNAIKIGMLATAEIATLVADFVDDFVAGIVDGPGSSRCPVVLDPILRSSSGVELLDAAGVQVVRECLLRLATVVTPNCLEAAILTRWPRVGALPTMGSAPSDLERVADSDANRVANNVASNDAEPDAESLALALRQMGAAAVVVTGGDGQGEHCRDLLAYSLQGVEMVETLSASRIHSPSTHGTGCAFSTAIACGLAQGKSIPAAVTAAKQFVRRAMERAPGLGCGAGPMGLDRAGFE